ncbi:type II toxin-antitoxin system VapC family toxin [Termitidicoccus mucosus]|uniref:Ribonuclease VapC n=1 Tax=Termitidicoccus mucosus TaxID=1184151 RepID=A0A178IP93_9BACT|nr:twitching motility protein PilT [Opitutaceae bacterium TSB47]
MIYLPDTNAVSAYMRGDNPKLVQKMQEYFGELCLSVIVLSEREFGVTKGTSAHARLKLAELAQTLPVEPFTRDDCTHYAAIRHDLESRGMGIGPMDTLIAAHALRLGATVVTRNVSEFRRVSGLKVENWQE